MKHIESLQNSTIKNILKLQEKSRERKKNGVFVIEGKREVSLAIKGNYTITTLLFCDAFLSENEISNFSTTETELISVSKDVYQKIAYRNSTEGIIAIAKTRTFSLENIQFSTSTPLILVAEAPEKPGNIGAILRTCDAANVDAVFIANPKTDMYNPNIIRSSIGCLFTNQIATGTSEEIIAFLKEKKINSFATTLQNSNEYHKEDYTKATAII
ncbi:MAG: TrmH family RNA methyltransferase, partial [Polaribacter sp.]